MAENSAIEWTDHTFNPWIGCTHVSEGCRNCYAETLMDKRYGKVKWGAGQLRKRTAPANWRKPIAWNRKAEAAGKQTLVFCASLADVFDPEVPNQWRLDLYDLIAKTPWLTWQLLTKRPEHAAMMERPKTDNWWLGTTVEDQAAADKRVPILLDISAPIRFVSCEPLLGPVILDTGCRAGPPRFLSREVDHADDNMLDWVICGGESGQDARPMHPAWPRALRDQCLAAGVPFLFKQWGAWAPMEQPGGMNIDPGRAEVLPIDRRGKVTEHFNNPECALMYRAGKKIAGKDLDGEFHLAFPAGYTPRSV